MDYIEYKILSSAKFSRADINNKASFFGLIIMIGLIAYIYRAFVSGLIWSVSTINRTEK